MQDIESKVKREKSLPFARVEHAIIDDASISIYALATYVALCRHADTFGQCFPGMATLARESKCSRRSTIRAIQELIDRGYVSKHIRCQSGRFASNVYTILSQYDFVPKQRGSASQAPGSARETRGVVSDRHQVVPERHTNYNQELKPGRKGEKNTVPPSVRKKIAAIRSDRYSKANDLVRVFTARRSEITAHIEQDKDNFYRAYRLYIRDDSPGLCKRNHPLALFLNQYHEWLEKSSPVQEFLDLGADKEKAEAPTDKERNEGVEILQNWKESIKERKELA